MNEEAFDISLLKTDSDVVAVLVQHDELFGLLRRKIQVPSGWVGLAIGEQGDRSAVPVGDEIASTGTAEVVFARTRPLRLAFEPGSVTSSDDYLCETALSMSVELSTEASDLAAFRSAVMGTDRVVALIRLRDYLADEVRRGLVGWARQRSAAELVDGEGVEALEAAIRESTAPPCFSAGMRVVGELTARFTSSALASVQAEAQRTAVKRDRLALEQQLRDAAESARRDHLEHVEQVLSRLREMSQASPGVSVAELIRQFGEDQRGQLYRSLAGCAPDAARCQAIVAAVGNELVWLDPDAPERPQRRQPAQAAGGAIRSVQSVADAGGRRWLAVGGAAAIGLLDPTSGQVATTLSWPVPDGAVVRGGINRVALRGTTVLATHSELGLCTWPLETPDEAQPLLTELTGPARAVRHVQSDKEGRVWLSVDDTVICLTGDDLTTAAPTRYAGSQGRVTALTVTPDEVYAGNDRGQVLCWSIDRPEACEAVYNSGAAACRSVHLAALMGIKRLGLTDDSDAVKALILGDTVVERYVAGGDRLREAWWSDDRMVALNAYQSRLYVWSLGRPEVPSGWADLGQLCSNRVHDVCLVTAPIGA